MALQKIGSGPWQVEDVFGPEDSIPSDVHVGTGCACCGSKNLKWRVVIRNTDGNGFVVGLTCARRAGGDVIDLKSAEEKAQDRALRARLTDEGFRTWATSQPHPKGWNGKTLWNDVVYWTRRSRPKLSVMNQAWSAYQAEKTGTPAPAAKVSKRDQERLDVLDAFWDKVNRILKLAHNVGRLKATCVLEGAFGSGSEDTELRVDHMTRDLQHDLELLMAEANKAKKSLRQPTPESYLRGFTGPDSYTVRGGEYSAELLWRNPELRLVEAQALGSLEVYAEAQAVRRLVKLLGV